MIWYRQGAANWNEALPLGNGRLGAMVYGGENEERICLNEDTLWSGIPSFYGREEAKDAFEQAGRLTKEEKYAEAQELMEKHATGLWSEYYMPLGQMLIRLHHGPVSGFQRKLDMRTGIHQVSYEADGRHYERQMFVSFPDQVMAMKLTADADEALTMDISLVPAMNARIEYGTDSIAVSGHCPTFEWHYGSHDSADGAVYSQESAKQGMGYYAELRILNQGGTVTQECGCLKVVKAHSVVILFNCRTSFNGWDKHPVLEGKEYIVPCQREIDSAAAQDFESLTEKHLRDHSALYDRCELELGDEEKALIPTDERLERHEKGESDKALYALYFHLGRYLTVAGSRKGTQAMNLQGIWNANFMAPWHSNYTVNINTEMNYWPTLMTNLAECYEPLERLIEELAQSGKRTAEMNYGAPGWVCHHNTDLWRMTTPVGSQLPGCAVYACWPMASGWFVRHLWERYEYTRDKDFLSGRAWNIMRGAAAFYLHLIRQNEEGKWVLTPATSPENTFVRLGKNQAVAQTAGMTQEILYDVLDIVCKTAK